jgi:predicted HicB family RNase H-like nuclease
MAYNEKAKERTIKYMNEKRDKLTLNLPKGDKDRYKAYAESRGMSLTQLIVELIEKEIES